MITASQPQQKEGIQVAIASANSRPTQICVISAGIAEYAAVSTRMPANATAKKLRSGQPRWQAH